MTYLNKNTELQRGYNTYIDTAEDDYGTMMDVGLLLMEEGDSFTIWEEEKECAVLLFQGAAEIAWNDKRVEAQRPDCFYHEAYCLLAPRRTEIRLTARCHSEIYIQKTLNERDYEAVLYTPETVQTQHAGAKGVKTLPSPTWCWGRCSATRASGPATRPTTILSRRCTFTALTIPRASGRALPTGRSTKPVTTA